MARGVGQKNSPETHSARWLKDRQKLRLSGGLPCSCLSPGLPYVYTHKALKQKACYC